MSLCTVSAHSALAHSWRWRSFIATVRVAGGDAQWRRMASRFTELVIDCANPARVAEFWAAVLDYRVLRQSEQGVEIGAPDGSVRPTLTFVPVPEAKTIKNRLHIDLNPTGQNQAAELE